jgi:adenylate cyclase
MGREIERKFLVTDDTWRAEVRSSRRLRQGYLAIDGKTNVRVRTDADRAWLTVKGAGEGISRAEFEYEIPVADAEGLLGLCRHRIIDKTRHLVPAGQHTWEIDEFAGANAGLIVAEIELREESDAFARPAWLGEEVTTDPRYLNASLAVSPWTCPA